MKKKTTAKKKKTKAANDKARKNTLRDEVIYLSSVICGLEQRVQELERKLAGQTPITPWPVYPVSPTWSDWPIYYGLRSAGG